jgi:hypothetical protein
MLIDSLRLVRGCQHLFIQTSMRSIAVRVRLTSTLTVQRKFKSYCMQQNNVTRIETFVAGRCKST